MKAILWNGILLGLGADAPIGPVNVEMARRTLRHGFAAGFLLGCGAVTVDVCYAILASLGMRPLLGYPHIMLALGIAGSLFLAYLGLMCLRSGWRQWRQGLKVDQGSSGARANYLTGLLMTSLNPMTLAFWFIVIPGFVGQISANPSRDLPWVCGGVFLGALGWVITFTNLLTFAARFSQRTLVVLADLAGGATLMGFAAWGIWQVAHHSL